MRFVTSATDMPPDALLIKQATVAGTFLDAWVSEDAQDIVTWNEGPFALRRSREGLFGVAETPCAGDAESLAAETRRLYAELFGVLARRPDLRLLRIWNFVPALDAPAPAGTRYQWFNRGRAEAFAAHFGTNPDDWIVPPASTVGAPDGTLRVELFAIPGEPVFLENKAQVPAPRYSQRYGDHAPVFSRGVVFDNHGQRVLVSAGTAAIKGEDARFPGDATAQFMESVDNMRLLISQFNLRRHGVEFGFGLEDLHLLRVCHRREQDRPALEALARRVVDPDCQLVFFRTDLCRPELLVEIDGIFLKKGEYRGVRPKYEIVDGRIRVESFELHVAEHCNLRCHMCDAMSPYNKRRLLALDEVERALDFLRRHIRADIFKLMGGEPLLHPDLVTILGLVRRSGITDTIRLTTNGLLLHKMPDAFWEALDRLTVSNYSSAPMADEHVALVRAKARAFGVVLNLKFIDQFNGVMLKAPIADHGRVQRIYDNCWVRHRSLVIRNGRFFKCTRAAYMDDFRRELRVASHPGDPASYHQTDGVPLNERFFENALAYLNSPAPLASCHYCLGASGRLLPHRQMSLDEVRRRHIDEGTFFADEGEP
jgi:organic radical activating enzyme